LVGILEVIQARRSIRKYKKELIDAPKLGRVLEAARLAPSAKNLQPWKFIIVTDSKIKEALKAAYSSEWFTAAPIVVIACAIPSEAWVRMDGEEYWKVDVAIAIENLILAATEEGLGTCWIGAFNEEAVKRAVGIPAMIRVVAMTPLGYPDESKEKVVNRKPVEEIIRYNLW
jgi:nitroreductase